MGQVLLNILINDIDSKIKCPLSKLADDTTLRGAIDTPEKQDPREAIQAREVGHENFMKFNKDK